MAASSTISGRAEIGCRTNGRQQPAVSGVDRGALSRMWSLERRRWRWEQTVQLARAVSGLCFAGKDFETLMAACRDRLFKSRPNVHGIQRYEFPVKPILPRL